MKNLSFIKILVCLILGLVSSVSNIMLSQVISITPEKPAFNENVTLTFYSRGGDGGLEDYDGDVYVHTGLITLLSQHPSDWKHVVSPWGTNNPKLKMSRVGDHTYSITFQISDLYQIPVTGGNVVGLAFVFRSEDGTKVGKDVDHQDIFYYYREPKFTGRPQKSSTSLAMHPDWATDAVIYEVNIRQYTEEGTFKAFAKHLPRLAKMGIDILWLMPVQPIGIVKRKGELGSYYSISDYKGINPEFGTQKDLKALIDQAHKLGMKVILDWVANHTSHDHHWTISNPEWYTRDTDGKILSPYDWTDVAELNYDDPAMRQAMIDDMAFWLSEMDIDGFRCDVAGEVPHDFWESARAAFDTIKEVWMLAENGEQLYLMNKAFNANYGWDLHHRMNRVAVGEMEVHALYEAILHQVDQYPSGSYPMQFITNHDENSWAGTITERLGSGHKAFATFMFTIPGVPLIYSGQEAGLDKRLAFFEKDPISWDSIKYEDFYSDLIALKHKNTALHNGLFGGNFTMIENGADTKVASYMREKADSKVLTIINFSNESQTITLNEGHGTYTNHFSGSDAIINGREITLAPWEYRVYTR